MIMRNLILTGFFIVNTSWASEATDRAESALATLDAATLTHLESVQPRATRAGWLRIVDDVVVSESGAPWLIHQLATDPDAHPSVRVAWADAMVRAVRNDTHAFGWGDAWVELAATDGDSKVRAMLLAGLRHGDAAFAIPALKQGLSHEDAATRAAAADGLAWHPQGLLAAEALRQALEDQDAEVRRMAATAAGYLGDTQAYNGLVKLLHDADPLVRAAAIRALERVAPERARALPQMQDLAQDTHTQIQRAASHLLNSGS